MAGDFFDPEIGQAGFSGLSDDDPLRAWAAQHVDPHTGALLATDPQAAIDKLISAGVPPPPADAGRALPFTDPATGINVPGDSPFSGPMVRTNPDGSISGNLTTPGNPDLPPKTQDRVPLPAPAKAVVASASPSSAGADLDPEEDKVPLPQARPEAAKAGDTKKPGLSEGLSDFSKSLQGVKPIAPPPLNAVGTPSVRQNNPIQGMPLSALLSLAGQGAPPSALATLGRLLAAGKV